MEALGRNYKDLDHEGIVSLINTEKYEDLVEVCNGLVKQNRNIELVKKIIYTLINLNEPYYVRAICDSYSEHYLRHGIILDSIKEFSKYENYSGALDLCLLYLDKGLDDSLHTIPKVIITSIVTGQDDKKLIEIVKKLLKINPQNSLVRELIQWAISVKNYPLTIEICSILLTLDLHNLDFLLNLIIRLNDNHETLVAKKLCKVLFKFFPQSPEVWAVAGYTFTKMGNYKKAFTAYNAAFKVIPQTNKKEKGMIVSYIGFTYICMGDFNKAIKICGESIRLYPKLAHSYSYLGLAYYKVGDLESAFKFIRTALSINKRCYHAWAILGQIYLEGNNYYEAFLACFTCLKNNNQYPEGIVLYNKLVNNLSFNILTHILPKLVELGYRKGVVHLNESSFPQEFLKTQRFISYSNEFQKFFPKVSIPFSEKVVAIYGNLPKCGLCKETLKIYGERINLKNNRRTYFYRCTKCGSKKEKVYPLNGNKTHSIKILVIVKPLIKKKEFKLAYEDLFITYYSLDTVQGLIRSKKDSGLVSELDKSVLLYGKDVFELNIDHVLKKDELLGAYKDAYHHYEEISNLSLE